MDKNTKAFSALGLDYISPFTLTLSSGELVAPLFLKNFGGCKGMIIVYRFEDIEPHINALMKIEDKGRQCYGFSTLSKPEKDSTFDLESIIDMLNDWKWTGDIDKKPEFLR